MCIIYMIYYKSNFFFVCLINHFRYDIMKKSYSLCQKYVYLYIYIYIYLYFMVIFIYITMQKKTFIILIIQYNDSMNR